MLRGPRHMPGAGPLPLFASLVPPTFFASSLFLTQTLSPITLSLFVQIFISSLFPIFLFLPFFSLFFQYLNTPPEGPAGSQNQNYGSFILSDFYDLIEYQRPLLLSYIESQTERIVI